MVQIIFTDEEKAKSWSDLDDESLGQCVKAAMAIIGGDSKEEDQIMEAQSAALILASLSHKSNSEETV